VVLDAEYEGDRALSSVALEMITRQLQEKLNLPTLVVKVHRVRVIRKQERARSSEIDH